jgi:hypothetical protein
MTGLGPDAAVNLAKVAARIAEGRALRGGKITKSEAKKLVSRFEPDDAT